MCEGRRPTTGTCRAFADAWIWQDRHKAYSIKSTPSGHLASYLDNTQPHPHSLDILAPSARRTILHEPRAHRMSVTVRLTVLTFDHLDGETELQLITYTLSLGRWLGPFYPPGSLDSVLERNKSSAWAGRKPPTQRTVPR